MSRPVIKIALVLTQDLGFLRSLLGSGVLYLRSWVFLDGNFSVLLFLFQAVFLPRVSRNIASPLFKRSHMRVEIIHGMYDVTDTLFPFRSVMFSKSHDC